MATPVYSGPWQRIRLQVLERDQWLCQIRLKVCTTRATCVDHIIPTSAGGSWWDQSNLRAACQPCNRRRVDRTHSEVWRRSKTVITLVVGPPFGGQDAWVAERRRSGDLVVDYEAIAGVIGGPHEAVVVARNALLAALRRGEVDARQAFIISSNPGAESMFPYHHLVVIDPGGEVVRRRGLASSDPDAAARQAEAWYAARSSNHEQSSGASRAW